MNNRVLLGMSGGVDSSVSAIVLKEQGFEVIGITFILTDLQKNNKEFFTDTTNLTKKLSIKHLVIDLRKEFRATVIKYFVNEYAVGKTPFPCAWCNPRFKFLYLNEYAKEENCQFIATGHYTQIKEFNGKKFIYKGVDPDKDQSFFLWGLNKELVNKLIFPLGNYSKKQIREIAFENGFLKLAKKKDSLGICFVEGEDYREFLKNEGLNFPKGNFIDGDGKILGEHNGIINYTIGQRRGLGINLIFPVFVSEIRLDANEIVLSKFNDLFREKVIIKNYQYIDIEEINKGFECSVKAHYRRNLTPCRINIFDEKRAEVTLLKSEAMIAPGQTTVFYEGDRLIGGGFIESSI